MGEIRGVITEKLEQKFRMFAMQKFGYRKGSISKALREALHDWIEDYQLAIKVNTGLVCGEVAE